MPMSPVRLHGKVFATVLAFPSTTANTLPCRRTGDIGMLPSTRGAVLAI